MGGRRTLCLAGLSAKSWKPEPELSPQSPGFTKQCPGRCGLLLPLGGVKNGRQVSSQGQCFAGRTSMPLPTSLPWLLASRASLKLRRTLHHPLNVLPPLPHRRKPLTCHGPAATAPPSGHPGEMCFPNPTGILDYNSSVREAGWQGLRLRGKLLMLDATLTPIVKCAWQQLQEWL